MTGTDLTTASGLSAPAETADPAAPPYRPSRLWLALMAGGSMAAAAVMALAVFPYGSVNDDEAIYRVQAHTLASGHLFPAAPDPAIAFRPWLAALVQHHYVLKYTPVEAAVLAASHLATGSYVPGLMATVAALVVATWLLASELLGDTREALLATALVACSPLVVIQSGLLLGYLTTLVLLELFAWAAIRGVRRGSGRWFVLSGLALGIAGAIRAYDAIIFAGPFLVWAAFRLGRRALRPAAAFLLGGVGPLAGFLAYNKMATGSLFKLPFNLQDSHDTIGFGLRRLNPTEDLHHFGPIQGLAGVGAHLLFLLIWVAGGP
ncbi:MAG TPA: glycosyltransferase family 39 protein, partial [Acidimicrobiales bacterium]|nr:glycosyltransferase family 39 protein [Acidimicrobiales bacterium]